MKKIITRFISLLLSLFVSILSINTAVFATDAEPSSPERVFTDADCEALDNDVFAKIKNVQNEVLAQKAEVQGHGAAVLSEAELIEAIPDVISAITSSDTYVQGSLQQNGNFLVWETTLGLPCCYDPRMEAQLMNARANELVPAEMLSVDEPAVTDAEIQNHTPNSVNIGLIQPYWESSSSYADSSFRSYSPNYKTMWQNLYAATGGSGIRYSMTNATVDNIADTIEKCALVIFDSHGTTDYSGSNEDYTSRANSSYLCLTTATGVTSTDTAARTGTYGTYYNALKGSGYAYVNGDCIAAHMDQNAPNSLVYMGICLGMATDKMFSGLRSKGVETVYGYSQSVSFVGEQKYMQSILGYVKNGDTFADALSKSKSSLGSWDPAYSSYSLSQAKSNKVAFPIAVSSEDTYPGQGNVDAVQTVYSTWSLFGEEESYTITATSNNTSYGTVTLSGNTITAAPKTGYYASGYTVTSGSATVTQNGNVFTVNASSDCTVQINFAAKTQYTVTLRANGSVYTTVKGYTGEAVTLPSGAAAVEGCTFVGWSANEVSETTSKPSFYAPGASYTGNANVTLYALYSYTDGTGTGETVYTKVTSAPSDWSGDYIITNTANTYALKGISGSQVSYESSSNGGSATLSNAGLSLSGSVISGATAPYIFTIEKSGSYYTIKNSYAGTYLASISSYLRSYTSASSSYCMWTPAYTGSAVRLSNSASSRYPYMGFSSNVFVLASSSSSAVNLYKAGTSAATYYATSPVITDEPDPTPSPDPTPDPVVTTYTVSFSVPSGVSAVSAVTVNEGSSLTLPSAGAPSGYTFVGWVTSAVSNASSAPSVLTGSYTPTSNITLKALYRYTTSSQSGYKLVTSAPSDWSGKYVITYGNSTSLYALKGLSGNKKYESTSAGGSIAYASTGMTLSGDTLTNVSDAYVFTASASGSYYAFRNASTGTYLASRSSYLYSYTSLSTSYCRWTPSMSGSSVILRNNASSRYPYLSFSSSKYFMINSSASSMIYLWKQTSGTSGTYYTTEI
ncbi:MAG: InlB B-repeat-containing protein [Erysipelotrichaceae bacterium]|nr:InlB B-repeat-containing protein [Erysipelotrichaceae bacterium]